MSYPSYLQDLIHTSEIYMKEKSRNHDYSRNDFNKNERLEFNKRQGNNGDNNII